MAMTNTQLQARILELERGLSRVLQLLGGVASRNELSRLVVSRQSLMDDIDQRVTALENRVTNISLGQQ